MPTSITITDDLLRAAFLCGMAATENPPTCHRTQIFYAVWMQLQRRNATNDLQRALETAAHSPGPFEHDPLMGRGGGRYRLTEAGIQRTRQLSGTAAVVYAPALPGYCVFRFDGQIGGRSFAVISVDGALSVFVDGVVKKGTEAIGCNPFGCKLRVIASP